MTIREIKDFGSTMMHWTPVIFRDKDGQSHRICSAVKPLRGGALILLEDCPHHYELSIDPHPKELIEWWENLSDEELKKIRIMTLNGLIRQCTAIAQQLSSGDIPLKCNGEEVDVEMWVGKDDEGRHYIHTYLVGAGNAEHSKILKRIKDMEKDLNKNIPDNEKPSGISDWSSVDEIFKVSGEE